MMAGLAQMAEQVRKNRKPVAHNNPLVEIQRTVSDQIVAALDGWRDFSEMVAERTFLTVYGSPALQAAAGIDPAETRPLRRAAKSPLHEELVQKRIAELKSRIPTGGVREAAIRGLLYAGMGRASVDERGFELVRRIRQAHDAMSLPDFKALVREQFYMLVIDQEAALAAIPSMLPADAATRSEALGLIREVLAASGASSAEDEKRLNEVAGLFGVSEETSATIPFRQNRRKPQAKAS
jgi:hypothetical protein